MRIGHDALGNDTASSMPKRRLPSGPKSIPQIQKEIKEQKIVAIKREHAEVGERYLEPSTEEVESEVSKALEQIAKGPIAKQGATEGMYVLDFSASVIRKHLNEQGLKSNIS